MGEVLPTNSRTVRIGCVAPAQASHAQSAGGWGRRTPYRRADDLGRSGSLGFKSPGRDTEALDLPSGNPRTSGNSSFADAGGLGRGSVPGPPLLVRSPHILAASRGQLTAIYLWSTRNQFGSPRALAEVLLARLALPPATRIVLAVGEHQPVEKPNWAGFFDDVISTKRRRSSKFPVRGSVADEIAEAVEPLRDPHYERFAEAWTSLTLTNRRRRRDLPGRPTSELLVERRRPQAPHLDVRGNRLILAIPREARRGQVNAWISAVVAETTRVDYLIDEGMAGVMEVSLMLRHRDAHLELHQARVPLPTSLRTFDSYKAVRSAAFAGYEVEAS
jgi:hypothetical protein